MKKILSKIVLFIVVTLLMFLLCIALVGCQPNGAVNYQQYSNKYNARVVKMNSSLKQSFLDSNRINYVFVDGEQIIEEGLPQTRTFVIKTDEEFNEIFSEDKDDIDFSKEILIIYVFADVHQNPYVVKNIKIEDAVLKIELDMISSGANNAKPPQRAFKFIRMKKRIKKTLILI